MNGKALSKAFTAVSALYPDCQAVKLTLDHQRWYIRECQRQLTAQIDLIVATARKPN